MPKNTLIVPDLRHLQNLDISPINLCSTKYKLLTVIVINKHYNQSFLLQWLRRFFLRFFLSIYNVLSIKIRKACQNELHICEK